jgi:hypothetical protein
LLFSDDKLKVIVFGFFVCIALLGGQALFSLPFYHNNNTNNNQVSGITADPVETLSWIILFADRLVVVSPTNTIAAELLLHTTWAKPSQRLTTEFFVLSPDRKVGHRAAVFLVGLISPYTQMLVETEIPQHTTQWLERIEAATAADLEEGGYGDR